MLTINQLKSIVNDLKGQFNPTKVDANITPICTHYTIRWVVGEYTLVVNIFSDDEEVDFCVWSDAFASPGDDDFYRSDEIGASEFEVIKDTLEILKLMDKHDIRVYH